MEKKDCKRQFHGNRIGFVSSFLILALVFYTPVGFGQASEQQTGAPDILIIYSTGIPFKTISKIKAEEIDAITTPTPSKVNCGTIAEMLASALRDRGLLVRVAETMEIKHRNEILHARLVVIGSPAYFWNVSWKIKKLLDEQFGKIYMMGDRLAKRRIAAFSMAGIEPSANAALKAIKAVVTDCKGRFGPTMIFLAKHSKREIRKRISQFAGELAKCLLAASGSTRAPRSQTRSTRFGHSGQC